MLNPRPRILSHFRQKTLLSVTALALLAAIGPAVTAQAEARTLDYPGLKTPIGQSETRTVSLSALTPISEKPVLDWRRPSYSLKFDVPDTDWTSSLQLTLSADPVSNAPRDAEIYVQFNDATPLKVKTRGRGFDARLSLNPAYVKPRDNVLKVFYKAPKTAECLLEKDGAWALNLAASRLTLRSRAKSRPLIISDIEAELSNPFSAPDKVSLVSFGDSATQIQSLLAQAVGLRMKETPRFSTTSDKDQIKNQVEFIAGRRDQISDLVKNVYMMSVQGPVVTLDEGRPLRVILTGDTDKEVLNLVQTFAQHHLPETRRALVSSGELIGQSLLSGVTSLSEGRTKLADLGPTTFDPGWNPKDLTLRFNVKDPRASQGNILLRLKAPEAMLGAENTVTLSLNGQAIGQTQLDKTQKSVSFPVPQGSLRGQDNIIKMSANIDAETGSGVLNGCTAQNYTTNGLYIETGSRLTLNPIGKTPLSDLSHLTATGAPFSDADGKNTLLVLPKSQADYQAALGLLAKLAKTSGGGWSEAAFTRESDQIETVAKERNIFFILPSQDIPQKVKSNAPKSFLSALRGKTDDGENLLTATAERYASAQTRRSNQDFAAKTTQRNRVSRGGVAALYASPYQSDKMIGVISNVSGDSFQQALETLSDPAHWNKIEGQVARWNANSVLMTELSSPLTNFKRTDSVTVDSGLNWPALNWPELDFSTTLFTLPEIHLPDVDLSNLKEKIFFWKAESDVASPRADSYSYIPSAALSAPLTLSPSVVETGIEAAPEGNFLDTILGEETELSESPSMARNTSTANSLADAPFTAFQTAVKSSVSTLDVETHVTNFLTQIKSIGLNWRANLKHASLPGRHISDWSLRQLSAVAVLFLLCLGVLIVLFGFSAPRNRAGKHL